MDELLALTVLVLLVGRGSSAATIQCSGDCNGNGAVTVDELITGVNIALGLFGGDRCPAFDVNADGAVTVDELVQGVDRALNGCVDVLPSRTATRTETATVSNSATASLTAAASPTATVAETLLPTATPSPRPLPTVVTDRIILGRWPQFTVSGASSDSVTRFRLGAQLLGSVTGNGTLQVPPSLPLQRGENVVHVAVEANAWSASLPDLQILARTLVDDLIDYPAFYSGRGYQRLGYALAVGDFNCDGFQDLAASAPFGTFDPLVAWGREGAVYVFYGSPDGLVLSPAPSASPASPTEPLALQRPAPSAVPYDAGPSFGISLTAGNINGDAGAGRACDDLVVGTAPSGTQTGVGEVWVFFGSSTGLQNGAPPVANAPACLAGACSPLVLFPPDGSWSGSNPSFGYQVAVGRFHKSSSGDPYEDIVVGAPGETSYTGGKNSTGAVWIYYGSDQGVDVSGTPPYTKVYEPELAAVGAAAQGWNFGMAVTAADLDSDGIDDLIVGAPEDANGGTSRGSAYYFSSRRNDLAAAGRFPSTPPLPTVYEPTYTRWTSVTRPLADGSHYGGAIADAGDLNGDGRTDLVVGSGVREWWSQSSHLPGIDVIYGGTSEPETGNGCATVADQVGAGSTCRTSAMTSCAAGLCEILNIPYAGGQPTWHYWNTPAGSNAAGAQDVDRDGYADVVVGWATDGLAARAAVFSGGPTGLGVTPIHLGPLISDGTDSLAYAVALGDFNGDMYSDVLVTAPDDGRLNGNWGGVIYGFEGRPGGIPPSSPHQMTVAANASKETYGSNATVAVGDINGDGFTDAIARLVRPIEQKPDADPGRQQFDAIVYSGSADGVITSPPPLLLPANPTDPKLLPGLGTQCGLGTEAPMFRHVVPAGDVNGDGYADIVSWEMSNNTAAGSCGWHPVLRYGSFTGIQAAVAPAPPPTSGLDPVILANGQSLPSRVAGPAPALMNDGIWSYSASYGDFNRDGHDDLALACAECLNGHGSVLVIFGSASGPQTDGVLAAPAPYGSGDHVVLANPCAGTAPDLTCEAQLLVGLAQDEGFGDAVSVVGDVNGDGFHDLLVGAPKNAAAGPGNGAAYLFFGSPSGLELWDGTASGLLIVPRTFATSGMTDRAAGTPVAAAGDVNHDGYADFLIASRNDTTLPGSKGVPYGGAFLFYGCANGMHDTLLTPGCPATGVWGVSASGIPAAPALVNTASCGGGVCQPLFFAPRNPLALTGGGWFGYWGRRSIGTVGDLNQNAHADVVIGTDYYFQSCTTPACPTQWMGMGAAVVFTGGPDGLNTGADVSRTPSCAGGRCTPYWIGPPNSDWGTTAPPVLDFSGLSAFVGLESADLNGDGLPDFVVSTSTATNGASTTAFTGGFWPFQ